MRRAQTTTGTGVICARYMCPHTVEAPGACAARSGCHKLRTVTGSALQGRPAGARRRRGRQRRGLRDARPRREPDGGHNAPAPGAARPRGTRWAPPADPGPPRCKLSRWPTGRRGRSAGAAAQVPVSSGGVLASISVGQVWVATRSDAPCVCMCARGRGNALFEHVFRSCGWHRGAVWLKSSSKDCTACLLQCCTARHWQPRTCVGGGAFTL